MKKTILILANLLIISKLAISQSVTLAPTNPASPSKGTVVFDNALNQLKYWDGTTYIPITNAAAATGWGLAGANLYTSNNVTNVGIGTTTPADVFSVKTPTGVYGITQTDGNITVGTYVGGGFGWLGTKSGHPLAFFTGNSTPQMTIALNGNVGIGYNSPTNKLQIGSVGATNYSGNQIAFGDGSSASAFFQNGSFAHWFSSTNIGLMPQSGGGNVGIGTTSPTDKLNVFTTTANYGLTHTDGTITVGTYVGGGFGWIGTKSAHPLTFFTNGGSAQMTVATNGNVGIGTTTPSVKLHVIGGAQGNYDQIFYDNYQGGNFAYNNTSSIISILADGGIWGNAIAAYHTLTFSDSRIKKVISKSNSAEDLATLNKIQITNYTMKDKATFGDKIFKKVIAQEVEKVYPEAVSLNTSTIPDIYSLAENVVFDENKKELTISLSKNYNLKIGEKVEFIHPKEGKIRAEVVAVSGNNFTVKDWQFSTDKIFVFGREVNDFRTVDYEAISMLGISAIQELSKENENLKKDILLISTRLQNLEKLLFQETQIRMASKSNKKSHEN